MNYKFFVKYFSFLAAFAISIHVNVDLSLAQIPQLPDIIVKEKPGEEEFSKINSNVDIEMLGLDNLTDGDNTDKKVVNNKGALVNKDKDIQQKTATKLPVINENNNDKKAINKTNESSKEESDVVEDEKKSNSSSKLDAFAKKIQSFSNKKSKNKTANNHNNKKKVLTIKINEFKQDERVEKTEEEVEREKLIEQLAKEKDERFQILRKRYLVDMYKKESYIMPKKKNLSWSDKFYVTKEMPPPLISRSRSDDNSHIPIIRTLKERIDSLFRTINSNDINAFNHMYSKIGVPDIRNSRGDTILTYALLLKRHQVVISILAKGADPDLSNTLGHTPLDIAIENLDLKSVKILIDNHADINYTDKYNRTYLMLAARKGYLPVVRALVEEGSDVNKYDAYGRTSLSIALRHKKEVIVKYLLKNGALTWIEKPVTESNQRLINELSSRWKRSAGTNNEYVF